MIPPATARRLERPLVVLIALHSYAVGAALLLLTQWGTTLGGWPDVRPLFFARQAGIFHFVVATAYLIELVRYRGVTILLTAKATAVAFLVAIMAFGDEAPWAVPVSAAGDAVMGLLVLAVHRAAGRDARESPRAGPSRSGSSP